MRTSHLHVRGWVLALVATLLALPLPAVAAPPSVTSPALRVFALRIGQGDATLIVSATGKTMLVDAGPQSSSACASSTGIITTLVALGLSRLDYFVASHYDADHIGCADEVLTRWPATTAVIDRGGTIAPPTTTAYANYVNAAGARRRTATLGETIALDGTALTVVAVNGNGLSLPSSDQNDRAVVLRLQHGAFDGVLGGDITVTMEHQLALGLDQVEWYKVHHHGSASSTSPAFLATVAPRVATMSMSDTNAYGHPHAATLDTLRQGNVVTYWTTPGKGAPALAPYDVVANGTIELRVNATGTAFDVLTPLTAAGYLSWGVTPPCTFAVAPGSVTFTAAGGSTTVTVSTADGCAWSAASSQSWLTLSRSGGTGAGSLTLTAAASSLTAARTATVTVGDQTVTVTQDAVRKRKR